MDSEAEPGDGLGMGAPPVSFASAAITIGRGERVRLVGLRVAAILFVLIAIAAATTEWLTYFGATGLLLKAGTGLLVAGALAVAIGGAMRGKARAGSISLADGMLLVRRGREERSWSVDDLRQGCLVHPDGILLCTKDGHEIFARLGRSESEALLEGAGLSAAARVVKLPIASAASQRRGLSVLAAAGLAVLAPLVVLISLLGMMGAICMLTWARGDLFRLKTLLVLGILGGLSTLLTIAARFLHRFLRPGEVVVGTDGILVREPSRQRFFAHDSIVGVERHGSGVKLRLAAGGSRLLSVRAARLGPLPNSDAPTGDARVDRDLEARATLLQRIVDARAVGGGSAGSRASELLERRGQSLARWREGLRALLKRESSYRDGVVLHEELIAIVDDPRASSTLRVAAATALSSADDAEVRRRVRVATEACADVELRAALEQAAEGEIEAKLLARIDAKER
ncbi:hypothetical protein A7982_12045 [Minicystis rosea]|nr:hypothetical protein A7982_12045 [Minicystis rosea]